MVVHLRVVFALVGGAGQVVDGIRQLGAVEVNDTDQMQRIEVSRVALYQLKAAALGLGILARMIGRAAASIPCVGVPAWCSIGASKRDS